MLNNQSDWRLQLLVTWEEIENPIFQKSWTSIVEKAVNTNIFFHPILINIWLKTYRQVRKLQPLFVYAKCEEQEVIFPLVLWFQDWKNGFLKVIIPAGYSDFDYHDPLFLKNTSKNEIEAFYTALHIALNQKVLFDRFLIDGLHEPYIPQFSKVIHSEVCLSWSLKEILPVDGLILPAKKRLAQDICRRYKRLQELGSIRFRKFNSHTSIKETNAILTIIKMHSKRWPNAYKAPDFHRTLLEEGLRAGLVDVVEMSLNGQPIAWQVSFSFKGRYGLYMPTIGDKHQQYGPGHLSLGFALAEAQKSGTIIVDHLRGSENYKKSWGSTETQIFDVMMDRKVLMSRVRIWINKLMSIIKIFLKKVKF